MAQLPEQRLPVELFLDLDRSGPVPLYYQISSRLEQAIRDQTLPAGSRLENEVALASRLGLSRPTIRRAIQDLVDQGLLVRRRGLGTTVANRKVHRKFELTSLYDDLVKSGQTPRTEVRLLEVRRAPDHVAEALGVPAGLDVTWIERLRHAGGEPLAIMHNAVPLDLLPLCAEDLVRCGLYELLRAAGHVPRMASQTVGAKSATAAEARLLGDSRGAPMLTMVRTAWDASGRAVEYGAHVYRASRYSFELTLSS